MILQAKTIKGKIDKEVIKTITFYNQHTETVEQFEYNKVFSLEVFSQSQLDNLLLKLNIGKEVLSEHFISYNSLLKDLILTRSVCFEINIDSNNNYKLVY